MHVQAVNCIYYNTVACMLLLHFAASKHPQYARIAIWPQAFRQSHTLSCLNALACCSNQAPSLCQDCYTTSRIQTATLSCFDCFGMLQQSSPFTMPGLLYNFTDSDSHTHFHALTALACCRCMTTAISMQWIQHSFCGALRSIPWGQSSVMVDNMMLRSFSDCCWTACMMTW